MPKKPEQTKLQKFFPWLLIVGAAIGLVASFVLTMDKIHMLEDPSYVPSCNINPIIACGSVITTEQASAFNFPNPFIGLIGFGVVITVGVSLLSGMGIKKNWYWRTFLASTALATAFLHWLMYQSIFNIGALCPWCMVVWAVTIPIFWYSLLWAIQGGYVSWPAKLKRAGEFLTENHLGVVVAWYLIIIGVILNKFWYFFGF